MSSLKRVLVVGYGSIGKRHRAILEKMGCDVDVVSRHAEGPNIYKKTSDVFKNKIPEYIVIAVETYRHQEIVDELVSLEYSGSLLIEKPMACQLEGKELESVSRIGIGYNMRFHPVIQYIKKEKSNLGKMISIQVSVSRYLPTMRGVGDYRQSYSSSKKMGGGVLKDFSHELDYLLYICGDWIRVVALGGKLSSLPITSDDTVSALIEMSHCRAVSLSLSFCDRSPFRKIKIIGSEGVIEGNLDAFSVAHDGEEKRFERDYNMTYANMHHEMLSKKYCHMATYQCGLKVDELIRATEESLVERKWIGRG